MGVGVVSRQIKFRVFDLGENEWLVNGTQFYVLPTGQIMYYDESRGEFCCGDQQRFKLVEWTGLHDKNGREIWEWDIVREIAELSGHEDRKRRGLIEWDNATASFVVKLLDREDGAWCQLNEGNPNNSTTLKYTEVLGNIHENPELLNGAAPK